MKTILIMAAIVSCAALVLPVSAQNYSGDPLLVGPGSFFGRPDVYGRGPQQDNGTLGFQNKNSNPPYGYWGTGPDYGNYRWPFTGPYTGDRPRGRPMDALTYAPVPIAAEAASVRITKKNTLQVSWPGGPCSVSFVTFDILDEADNVMVRQNATQYPYAVTMPLPGEAQKVRVTVRYPDGFSTNVFWVPW